MPLYTITLEQDDEPATSARPTAIEALAALDEALDKGWTLKDILRDDQRIERYELELDAADEGGRDE